MYEPENGLICVEAFSFVKHIVSVVNNIIIIIIFIYCNWVVTRWQFGHFSVDGTVFQVVVLSHHFGNVSF